MGTSPSQEFVVDAVFLAALTLGLRARSVAVGPEEVAASAALTAYRPRWRRDELVNLLSPVLTRRNQDKVVLENVLDLLAPRPAPPAPPPAPVDFAGETIPPEPQRAQATPPFWPAFRARLAGGLASLRERLDWASAAAVVVLALSAIVLALSFLPCAWLRSLFRFVACPMEHEGPWRHEGGNYPGPSEASILAAAAAASACVCLALIAFGYFQRPRDLEKNQREAKPRPPPPPRPPSDGSVFRVGAVGGRAPPFLSGSLPSEIVEVLGYRLGEVDRERLDISETLRAHAAGADPAELCFEPRRELPRLLLLVDSRSDARQWNTLPLEFERILAARGVAVDRLDYYRSFFSRAGRAGAGTVAALVEEILDDPGWTVTVVFGEARTLAARDCALLRRACENGPALFFDFDAPALWDERHLRIADTGAWIAPATGIALRDGLSRIFSPTQAGEARFALPVKPAETAAHDVAAMPEDLAAWAAECALLQPTSYALAEKLRMRPQASALDSLAFSRLLALEGAFVGPEGLQFEPSVRRALQNRFLSQPSDKRAETVAFIADEADAIAAKGADASLRRRAALAQLRLFSEPADSETGFAELRGLLELGALERDPADALIGSFVAPQDTAGKQDPAALRLPEEPMSAATRLMIAAARSGAPANAYRRDGGKHEPARWTVAAPEIRHRVATENGAAPQVAFIPGADSVLVEGAASRSSERTDLVCINTSTGVSAKVELSSGVRLHALAVSEQAAVVAVLTQTGQLLVAPLTSFANLQSAFAGRETSTVSATRSFDLKIERFVQSEAQSAPVERDLLALNAPASLAAVRDPGAPNRIYVAELAREGQGTEVSFEEPVGCMTFANDRTLAVGSGRTLYYCGLNEPGYASREPLFTLGETITAVQTLPLEGRPSPLLAATADGRIYRAPPLQETGGKPVEIGRARGAPRHMELALPLAERAAMAITTDEAERAEPRGVCLAVLTQEDELQLLGLAMTPEGEAESSFSPLLLQSWGSRFSSRVRRVLAVSPGGQKIASLSGERLEIRPVAYELPYDSAQTGEAAAAEVA